MGITTPFPEPDSAQLRRAAVQSHQQVIGWLRTLAKRGVPLNVFLDAGTVFDVMRLRHVDVINDELMFDGPAHTNMRHRMLESASLTCVGFVETAKLQFSASGARATLVDGTPAISTPLPAEVFHFERRASVRVQQDGRRGAVCRLPLPHGSGEFEALPVLDIGAGGLAVLTLPKLVELAPGAELDGCRLDLPGQGGAVVSLRIRHIAAVAGDDGARWCGCEFVRMSPAVSALLARYVGSDSDAR